MIVFEPRCTGNSHSQVNAAILNMLSLVKPAKKILFIAEDKHIDCVKIALELNNKPIQDIEFIKINVPLTNLNESDFTRMPYDEKNIPFVFEYAQKNNINKIIFTYCTTPQIYLTKKLLKAYPNIQCFGIVHEIMAEIKNKTIFQLIRNFLRNPRAFMVGCISNFKNKRAKHTFKEVFLNNNTEKFKFLVLGDSIKQAITKKYPHMKPFILSINMPYLYGEEKLFIPFENEKIQFGIFGFLQNEKGYPIIKRLIKDFKNSDLKDSFEFKVIGTMKQRKKLAQYVIPASTNGMITREEFDKLSQNIDYALFLYPPEYYEFRASASFFDSIAYVKPSIALNSLFISHYFKKFGNIGYLCSDYTEVKKVFERIIRTKSVNEYCIQQQNLRNSRKILNIDLDKELDHFIK